MRPDVAIGERAENGIDQRMQRDIGVGMSGDAARMRNSHAAKHDVVAVGEGMHIKAIAGAHIGKARQVQNFGAGKIVVGRHLDVAGFAFEHADAVPGPFRESGIVGKAVETGRGRAAMRIEDQIEGKCLWRLHDAQSTAVEGFNDSRRAVDGFHRVGDGDAWHGGARDLAGGDGAANQRAAEKWPRRVVDEDQPGRAHRQSFESGAHRGLARRAAGNRRRQILQPGRRRAITLLVACIDDRLHHANLRVIEKCPQCRPDHRLAGNVAILLWHIAPGAFPAPGRNDDGGYPTRHEFPCSRFLMALAHVAAICDLAVVPGSRPLMPTSITSRVRFAQVSYIAVQHLRCPVFWLNSMQQFDDAYLVCR